eukprot:5605119-Amphidinium_carterae.2
MNPTWNNLTQQPNELPIPTSPTRPKKASTTSTTTRKLYTTCQVTWTIKSIRPATTTTKAHATQCTHKHNFEKTANVHQSFSNRRGTWGQGHSDTVLREEGLG